MYADYSFYTDSYYGSKISEEQWNYYSEKASDFLSASFDTDSVTSEALAKACCACAEVYYSEYESSENISSEKVGDYSVTYSASATKQSGLVDKLLAAAGTYFPIVGWC
ncbi:hypothetical protein [Ruminococcus flavefaciens]|uniref:hypothetical protein n=1 Tax=Ruminococcus flavefaciens TaxID=1265 RepID=UPI0026EE079F|nr:hypothetical protein [Ruminococcus flavefaciens]